MNRFLTLQRAAHASPVAIAALVMANAVPLAGVLLLGWDLATLVAVYWAENGVVGVYAVGRILTAANAGPLAIAGEGTRRAVPGTAGDSAMSPAGAAGCAKAFMVPFFCVHYGIFWLVHGVFVWAVLPMMFAAAADGFAPAFGEATGPDVGVVVFAALVMLASHGVSFVVNWLIGGEYRTSSAAAEMAAPYARVVILHLTIIFGAFAVALLGQPIGALVVMVVLKTAVDLAAHLGERARAAERAQDPGLAAGG